MSSEPKNLLETNRLRVVQITQHARGVDFTREIVRHPGSVAILPLLEGQRVCLIKNHRVSVDRALIELPAGTLEPGEDPRTTAQRELSEETGYSAERLEPLCAFYLSPGILDERMHLFLATGLTSGPSAREPDERIENYIVSWHDALAMIEQGQIQDAKTILGLLFYDRLRVGKSQEGPIMPRKT